jgi:hypothetical protein
MRKGKGEPSAFTLIWSKLPEPSLNTRLIKLFHRSQASLSVSGMKVSALFIYSSLEATPKMTAVTSLQSINFKSLFQNSMINGAASTII